MPWPKTGLYRVTPRGEKVFLGRYKWFNHICASHPELRNLLGDVLATIERPEGIYRERNTYFSFRYSERRGKFIMLVYKVSSSSVGKISTAYAVMNPWVELEGCRRVWPR